MEEALSFFRAFEVWIYLLLGLGGLIYVRKFILSWQDLREASFGLERENAQSRLNQSASILVLLLTMAVMEFVLVTFVAPAVPGATPLLTPTLDLLATPTITLVPETLVPGGEDTLSTPVTAAPPTSTAIGCIPGEIEISSPANEQEVRGIIEVMGTANISNFGFYKLEMKRPDEINWLTIQAGNTVVQGGKLGDWDTGRLIPGEYQLGLVVVNNAAESSPPCFVQVRVAIPLEETTGP